MRIIDVSQEKNTEEWLECRRGRITGTKVASGLTPVAQKSVSDLKRLQAEYFDRAQRARTKEKAAEYTSKADSYDDRIEEAEEHNRQFAVSQPFWDYLAELWAQAPDGEPPMDRGHRLENINASMVVEAEGIEPTTARYDTGMWVSDVDERISVSPDCHEDTAEPSWAIECKSLATGRHLAAVVPILLNQTAHGVRRARNHSVLHLGARVCPEALTCTRDYDLLKLLLPAEYARQAVQYFVVDDGLETLYFSLYDDRVYSDELAHCYLTITRESIMPEIAAWFQAECSTLTAADLLSDEFLTEF